MSMFDAKTWETHRQNKELITMGKKKHGKTMVFQWKEDTARPPPPPDLDGGAFEEPPPPPQALWR